MKGIIYLITNKKDKRMKYVGQTTRSLERRWREHCDPKSGCTWLVNAIQDHGKDSFSVKIIKTVIGPKTKFIKDLNRLEKYYIKKYNTLAPNGYNLTTGGKNHVASEETKKWMSKAQIKRFKATRGTMFGKHHSEESNKKNSESHKGKTPFLGKHHSKESNKKNSKAHIGLQAGEKHPLYGKTHSKETKKKMSKSHIKQWLNPNAREKASKAGIKRFADAKARELHAIKTGSKPFQVFKKNTHEFVGKWINQHECAMDLGISNTMVSLCLNGIYESGKSYIFKYIKQSKKRK